jgi:type I restriction enzyme R subunit
MPHAYTEDQLVEQPAIGLFAELGWQTVSAREETSGAPSRGLSATLYHPMSEGASLGGERKGKLVLVSRLRAALEREIDELVYALYGLTPEEIKLPVRVIRAIRG